MTNVIWIETAKNKVELIPADNVANVEIDLGSDEVGMQVTVYLRQGVVKAVNLNEAAAEDFIRDYYGER